MALVTVGLPVFSGNPNESVKRHIELFSGYLNGIGIDPANQPAGDRRAKGLFRASLTGGAAEWYDREILGKRWKLNNLLRNHGQANWANLVARNMGQLLGTNSIRPHTDLNTFATNNNATALNDPHILPAYGLRQNWKMIDGQPTDDLATAIVNENVTTPIVLPELRVGCAVYWFEYHYETVQRARREARWGDIVQDNRSIEDYYKEIKDIGELLDFPPQVIEQQFFRGLNNENLLEADRQGDKPLDELVKSLKKIEQRKAEMKIGISRRFQDGNPQQQNIQPSLVKPVISAQEPVIMKPVTSHAITQDMLDSLLKSHTENLTKSFQAQLQGLQDTVAQSQQSQKKVPPPIPPKDHRQMHEWYASHAQNPFENDQQYTIDDILGNNGEVLEYAKIFAKASAKAKQAKMDRKVNRLANMMDNLNIEDDGPLPMDVDLTDGIILQDADGNEFTVCLTRGSKKK